MVRWDKQIQNNLNEGNSCQLLADKGHIGSLKFIEQIEKDNSGYIYELFNKAFEMRGSNSTFTDLALQINLLSTSTLERRPVL